jgi:hypothetical protein
MAGESALQCDLANRIGGADESRRGLIQAQTFDELAGRLAETAAKFTMEMKPRFPRPARNAGQGQALVKATT